MASETETKIRKRHQNERCHSPPNTYSSDVSEVDYCEGDIAQSVSSEEMSAILGVKVDVKVDCDADAGTREDEDSTDVDKSTAAEDQSIAATIWDERDVEVDGNESRVDSADAAPAGSSLSSRTDGFQYHSEENLQMSRAVHPEVLVPTLDEDPSSCGGNESATTKMEDLENATPSCDATAIIDSKDRSTLDTARRQANKGISTDLPTNNETELSALTVDGEQFTSSEPVLKSHCRSQSPPSTPCRSRSLPTSDSSCRRKPQWGDAPSKDVMPTIEMQVTPTKETINVPQREAHVGTGNNPSNETKRLDPTAIREKLISVHSVVTTPAQSPGAGAGSSILSDSLRYARTNSQRNTARSQDAMISIPGRRSIHLQLLEDVSTVVNKNGSILETPFRKAISIVRNKRRSHSFELKPNSPSANEYTATPESRAASENSNVSFFDRGTVTVSWYEGTTSLEMQEHVKNCVLRKLNTIQKDGNSSSSKLELEEMRLLDEGVTPAEEVVLCPYLPDGTHFLLKFKTKYSKPKSKMPPTPHEYHHPYASRAPDSPSAARSPYTSAHDLRSTSSVHAHQLHVLNAAAAILKPTSGGRHPSLLEWNTPTTAATTRGGVPSVPSSDTLSNESLSRSTKNGVGHLDPPLPNHTDRLIEQQLRQLNELLVLRRAESNTPGAMNGVGADTNLFSESEPLKAYRREERKQVIFVIANYFVLFMSLIAISAEIQTRLPFWMDWVQENVDSVQNCATDRDALFDCVSNGNFSGLVASFLLWATQSVAAKRIFLFGFDSPKRLWIVVYEALVTAMCWGVSYMFIRRGLNPNTRFNFLHKYWKDAVYGSLAGFNAAFMKAVLKNLVPQDVALEALESRQLRIVHWLGALLSHK